MPVVASYYDAGGVSDINSVIASAAGGGHEEIVRWCHDKGGASHVDKAMAKSRGWRPQSNRAVVPRVGRR